MCVCRPVRVAPSLYHRVCTWLKPTPHLAHRSAVTAWLLSKPAAGLIFSFPSCPTFPKLENVKGVVHDADPRSSSPESERPPTIPAGQLPMRSPRP
jgi:hypothetical protein